MAANISGHLAQKEGVMLRGSNLLRLADYNQAVILDLIRRSPGRSRADLQRNSGLSSQTISNITRRLIDNEMIKESMPTDASRGRPSIPLTVNGGGAFAVGVHIDPARLTILLMDVAGVVLHQQQMRTPQTTNPDEMTSLIAISTGRLIRESGIDRDRVLGLGIAVPGPLDVRSGVVLDPPQLPKWRGVRLRSDLYDATGMPVLLDKDVTACAAAELRASADPDFLFVYLGSGVGASVMSRLGRDAELADVFVLVADSLRADYDVIDTMDVLVQAATRFTGAVEAGILLRDAQGSLHVVASTSERASDVEETQLGANEGPCLECIRSGEPVEVPDIEAANGTWPRFAAASEARGLRSAHAVPLRLRTDILGGLNLFSNQTGTFSERDAVLALALAQIATISMLQNRIITDRRVVTAQLQQALDSRIVIEQAKGVIANQHGVGMDGAFALLRNHARNNSLGLSALAEQVVTRRLTIT